jgi:hypothetical protein
MSDHYNHGQSADWRQRAAMASADKVGGAFSGAFSGWRPVERRRSSWWLVLGGALAVMAALRFL